LDEITLWPIITSSAKVFKYFYNNLLARSSTEVGDQKVARVVGIRNELVVTSEFWYLQLSDNLMNQVD